jgi:hypothetical protein
MEDKANDEKSHGHASTSEQFSCYGNPECMKTQAL